MLSRRSRIRRLRAELFRDCFRVHRSLLGWSYPEVLLALIPGLRLHRLRRTLQRLTHHALRIDEQFLSSFTIGERQYLAAVVSRTVDVTEWFNSIYFGARSDGQTMRGLMYDIYRLREALSALTGEGNPHIGPLVGTRVPRPAGEGSHLRGHRDKVSFRNRSESA